MLSVYNLVVLKITQFGIVLVVVVSSIELLGQGMSINSIHSSES